MAQYHHHHHHHHRHRRRRCRVERPFVELRHRIFSVLDLCADINPLSIIVLDLRSRERVRRDRCVPSTTDDAEWVVRVDTASPTSAAQNERRQFSFQTASSAFFLLYRGEMKAHKYKITNYITVCIYYTYTHSPLQCATLDSVASASSPCSHMLQIHQRIQQRRTTRAFTTVMSACLTFVSVLRCAFVQL